MLSECEYIVNADDLAMTPGANSAIFDAFDRGRLTHTSIMANGDYFDEAVEGLRQRPGLGVGVHLNLSYGRALERHRELTDGSGVLKHGFVALLARTLKWDMRLMEEVEKEFRAQIERVLESGFCVTHLDSHRHVHMIPALYTLVVKLAAEYGIGRVRLIRESFLHSVKLNGRLNFIANGGIVKYLLLRTLALYNGARADLSGGKEFFSILYTGAVPRHVVDRIVTGNLAYEVMTHPSHPDKDTGVTFYDPAEKAYRISKERQDEWEALLYER